MKKINVRQLNNLALQLIGNVKRKSKQKNQIFIHLIKINVILIYNYDAFSAKTIRLTIKYIKQFNEKNIISLFFPISNIL